MANLAISPEVAGKLVLLYMLNHPHEMPNNISEYPRKYAELMDELRKGVPFPAPGSDK